MNEGKLAVKKKKLPGGKWQTAWTAAEDSLVIKAG